LKSIARRLRRRGDSRHEYAERDGNLSEHLRSLYEFCSKCSTWRGERRYVRRYARQPSSFFINLNILFAPKLGRNTSSVIPSGYPLWRVEITVAIVYRQYRVPLILRIWTIGLRLVANRPGDVLMAKQRPNEILAEQGAFEEQRFALNRQSVLCRCKIVAICD
jgi:hypothetical protein